MSSKIALSEIHSDGRGAHLQLTFFDNEHGRVARAYMKGRLEMDRVQFHERGNAITFRVPANFDNSDFQRWVAKGVRQARTVSVHGGYAMETRFIMTQHMYAGSDHGPYYGFVEVLEIQDPPEGRHPIVVFENWSNRIYFYEFKDLAAAEQSFGKIFVQLGFTLGQEDGLIRAVGCGARRAWFYAKEGEMLSGDFVVESEPTQSS